MNALRYLKIAAVVAAVFLTACRGQTSEDPPIHPNLNMDQQTRVEAQEYNEFFTDNRAMRQPVEGTMARGGLRQDKAMFEGINEDSSFIEENPIEITKEFLIRGQTQYETYCTPCHGVTGDGQGIVVTGQYGLVPPPSYHIDRLRNQGDGYMYSVIANGIRTMRPYAHQIEVKDRWAIVAYVRALQRSQNIQETEMQEYDIDLASMKAEAREQLAAEKAKKEAEEAASAGAEVTAAKGKQLSQTNTCTTCHSADGSEMTGPTWQNLYGYEREMADGTVVLADEDYLTESIVNSTAKTVKGFAEGSMANFSYLSSNDVDNIIAYIKSLSDKEVEESSSDSTATASK
jgi:mono/diheme cytochrome c family protein